MYDIMPILRLGQKCSYRTRTALLFCVVILIALVVYSFLPRNHSKDIAFSVEYQLLQYNRTISLPSFLATKRQLCPIVISSTLNEAFADTLANFSRVEERPWKLDTNQGCQAFKKIAGEEPMISQEELEFPLAFSFNIHTGFAQFARLLRAVFRKHNAYCLHIDEKSEATFRNEVKTMAQCMGPNVYVIPKQQSYSINWGDFGTIEAWILCAKHFLQLSSVRWKYMLNGSGQEFPLRTNWELVKALKALNGSNIIESDYPNTGKPRAPRMQLSFNLTWFKGSVYTALRRDMVQFALTNKNATEIVNAIRTHGNARRLQDEIFFPTLAYNPQLNAPGGCLEVNRPTESDPRSMFVGRFAHWYGPCLSKYARHAVCIMGVRNIPNLIRRQEFFVNKFIYDFQPLAYDCLEWWLFTKISHEREFGQTVIDFDPSFYSKLYCSVNHL
ncbi:unnamed protein product [Echinostoma caproni]|uniref:Protein xylosyltransferase n=1 Tax=Echinostoma caproni TaxID=27848 RepID=A0A183A714_9TREM|nr:unnamed protein product [Echinostoma caproni]